jgi:hypothetical protein
MRPKTFQITQPFNVFGINADGTACFFALPPEATITVVAESAVTGRVQILYDRELYITFKRNLMLHLNEKATLAESAISFAPTREISEV